MAEEEPAQETHDKGIYPETPGHAVPEPIPLKAFQPWHLPRKQWVRRVQWKDCTKRLVESLHLDDRPLRYLGLPGTELLDLEVLANFCVEKNLRFRYLGFNSGAQSPGQQTTQRLAEDLLKSMDGVDSTSIVCTDDIVSLASKTSLAYNRLKGYESFDVINLDLCDVFTTRQGRSVHAAVKNLVEFQVNGRTHPWLLFVTTAIDRDAVADEDVVQYKNKFEENAARWDEFRQVVGNMAGQGADAIGVGASAFSGATGVRFGKLLAVSIGKWLASVLKQPTPWRVELKSCVCYRRGLVTMRPAEMAAVPEPELFSLVFGMYRVPQQLGDPAGLAGHAAPASAIDWNEAERIMALQMARKALYALDLDLHLQSRPDEYKRLTEESALLLSFRNYDAEAYHQFATSIPALPVQV